MKKAATVAGVGVAAFALGATLAGGITIATADDDEPSGNSETSPPWGEGRGPHGGHMRGGPGAGSTVTGDEAQKAIDAATAAVPGTADHAHKLPDGTYRVMVRGDDGTMTVVSLDAQFAVTGQQEAPMRGAGRGHGPGQPATDDQTQKVTEAVLQRLQKATVLHVMVAPQGGYVALARTDAGRKRIVLLDEDYAITSVRKNPQRSGPGRHKFRVGKDVVGSAFKKAERAALEEYPGGTVMGVHKVGKRYFTMVRTADGEMVRLRMNSDFEVTGTREAGPRGPGMGSPVSA